MTNRIVFSAIAAASLFAMSTQAFAVVCKRNYYTGYGEAPSWKTGRSAARVDWHNIVKGAVGSRWSKWSNARVKDESCFWQADERLSSCQSKAYPCK